MKNKIALFTIFLFTVSAARITVNQPATDLSVVRSADADSDSDASNLIKTSSESVIADDSNILLPIENAKSDSDEATGDNRLPEPEKTSDHLTPNTDLARFHTINRHFSGKTRDPRQIATHRRPCRLPKTPYRTAISEGNDVVSSSKTSSSDPETFRVQVPSNWLDVKHHYGSHRHHHHRQHKQKKREDESAFMKGVRKFLMHTFD